MRLKYHRKKMSPETILLLALIGLVAGLLSGLIGVGGGTIIVPALVFFLGYSQHEAQGTSLGLLLLPIGILAVVNYYNKGFIDVRTIAIMAVAFLLGGWVGSKMALAISEEMLRKLFAVILLFTAIHMLGWDMAVMRWLKNL